ncbi:MAG: PLP-dependent aminotransferase family protein [Chloroflexota bacterium]|nr:PLP-dependent aminotransferase family protein [Chloroflexota bacterium]
MNISLKPDSAIPLYLQIKEHLREQIEQGSLPPMTRLPSTRSLAEELGVSRVTVVNAYDELKAEGWVRAHVGRGTFVSDPRGEMGRGCTSELFSWQTTFLRSPGVSASNMLADMLHLSQQPNLISFAMGAPATDLLPARDLRRAINTVLRKDGAEALQYDEASGYKPLRRIIAEHLRARGLQVRSREVLITSGSQQGLDLAARVLTEPGDWVITESPTYLGALDVFQSHGVRVIGVPLDKEGMRVEMLEEFIRRHHPRVIYTIPTFHNPTGITMSERRRERLLELAGKYDLLILEDAVCSELRYDGEDLPSLKALDQQRKVIYLNSFSKILLPGIRVGYVVAPRRIRERLVAAKRSTDLFTSSLMQRALAEYLAAGHLDRHLSRVRQVYRTRRNAMLDGLARHLSADARWNIPQGGLCLWVTLKSDVSAVQLYLTAIGYGVAFAVGSVFFPQVSPSSSLRLNFAAYEPKLIEEGLRRLGKALREEVAGGARVPQWPGLSGSAQTPPL